MKRLKNVLISFVLTGFIIFTSVSAIRAKEPDAILFWGVGCPYCDIAKDEIVELGLDKVLDIQLVEIYYDRAGAQLFNDKIKECGLSSSGVPMLFVDGMCWIGSDQAIFALERKADGVDTPILGENQTDEAIEQIPSEETEDPMSEEDIEKGKQNTEILLASIFGLLVIIVGAGYLLQSKKSPKSTQAIILVILSAILLMPFLSPPAVNAVCPVCTAAVGVGLGLSRYLKIDDVISSLWIGAVVVSMIFWFDGWIKNKKGEEKRYFTYIFAAVIYGLLFYTLSALGISGHSFNTLWGIDKIILGVSIGSVIFFLAAKLHFYLLKKNDSKVYLPFQKVVLTVASLLVASTVFYLIIY